MLVATRPDDLDALLAGGTRALVEDGDLQAARQRFDMAYRAAARAGNARAMAIAALGLGGLWVHEHRRGAASALVTARLSHALSLVDTRSSLAVRLRVRLAGESDYGTGGHAAIVDALDEARAAADPVVRAEALSIAHHCLLGPEHGELRQTLAGELVTESFRTGRRSDLLMGILWQTVDRFLAADPHAARRLTEVRDLLSDEDHLAVGFVVSAIEVMLAVRTGHLDRAEELADACARRGTAAGDVDAPAWHVGQLVAIRWYQGRLAELMPILDELVDSASLSPVDNSCLGALAVAAASTGDRRKAISALALLRGHDLANLPRSSTWLVTMNAIVQAAHLLGDTETSERAYQLLSPFADLPMMASLGVACFGSVHHALGVACLTTGDAERAVTHLSAAVQQNLALAHWPAVVESRLRLAQALTRRAQPKDAAAARLEMATATREAAALDLTIRGESPRDAPRAALVCTREGRYWRISLGHRSTSVEHNIGMFHLAVLIANPGQEIPAIDLAAGVAALSNPNGGGASGQSMLDHVAVRDYRERLARLRNEIDELEATDPERAALRRAERDWLVAELARATGIGGRPRRFPDEAERARVAVGKAIRRAILRIAETDALVAEHLQNTVHTGLRCYYRPL